MVSSPGPVGIPSEAADARPGTLPRDPLRTLTSIGVVVYDWDLGSDEIAWGANAEQVLGFPDMVGCRKGRDFARHVQPRGGATRDEAVHGSSVADEGSGTPYAALYGLTLPGGRPVTVDDTGRWFADAAGHPARAHGVMRVRPAEPDEISLNRARTDFLGQLSRDLAEIAPGGRALTVFALAIGNLSELNDALGFEGGDAVIETVLARMAATLRQRDRFVRYSGNRFALALRGCDRDQATVAAERIARLVCGEPAGTAQGPVEIRLLVGGATAPDHAADGPTLLRRAEATLGLAKRRSGVPFLMYDPRFFRNGMRRPRGDALLDGVELLNGRRLALACQPVVEAVSREPAFHEALLRVVDADGRVQPAGDIVPALERGGLVHLADARVLELAVEHLAARPAARLSFNVSPLTLERPDWLAILSGHLGARPGVAARLILEVTETAAIADPAATSRLLQAVKALGVTVAIDDFGAGHTSFRNLRAFPVDLVKIDGAFVQNLARSPDDRFFVRTLIDLARHLEIGIVAEWVEDDETARLLAGWGADYLQGDHCGRPELIGSLEATGSRRDADPGPDGASRVA